jgi:leucyl-tRNA synthetase
MYRFLQRLWRNLVDENTGELKVGEHVADLETMRFVHRTIDGVSGDLQELRFNTAIAKLIELNNHLTKLAASGPLPRAAAEALVLMLAPLTPHVAEELWAKLGHPDSLAYAAFPLADPSMLISDSVEYPVQINGKVRTRITVSTTADPATVEALALADAKVVIALDGRPPKKVVVVPGRMVNIVV